MWAAELCYMCIEKKAAKIAPTPKRIKAWINTPWTTTHRKTGEESGAENPLTEPWRTQYQSVFSSYFLWKLRPTEKKKVCSVTKTRKRLRLTAAQAVVALCPIQSASKWIAKNVFERVKYFTVGSNLGAGSIIVILLETKKEFDYWEKRVNRWLW